MLCIQNCSWYVNDIQLKISDLIISSATEKDGILNIAPGNEWQCVKMHCLKKEKFLLWDSVYNCKEHLKRKLDNY